MKTVPTEQSVADFIDKIDDERKKADALELLEMMKSITGQEAVMWGPSIIGFGQYHYKYESGREGDMLKIGFSPRKTALTLYIMPGFERYDSLMQKLGKYKTGKSCLYIKKLDDIDRKTLKELIKEDYTYMVKKYGADE